MGVQITDGQGKPVEPAGSLAKRSAIDDPPRMALHVEDADYRVRADAPEFHHQGELIGPGDVRPFSVVQARAAAQWIETMDGKGVPMEGQQIGGAAVPRANLAGMARHERIGALQGERDALRSRLDRVEAQLAAEEDAQAGALNASKASQAEPGAVDGELGPDVRPIDPMAARVLTPGKPAERIPMRDDGEQTHVTERAAPVRRGGPDVSREGTSR